MSRAHDQPRKSFLREDFPHPSALEVSECLLELPLSVHDEGPISGDRFLQWGRLLIKGAGLHSVLLWGC